jgi:hypothetical protein
LAEDKVERLPVVALAAVVHVAHDVAFFAASGPCRTFSAFGP